MAEGAAGQARRRLAGGAGSTHVQQAAPTSNKQHPRPTSSLHLYCNTPTAHTRTWRAKHEGWRSWLLRGGRLLRSRGMWRQLGGGGGGPPHPQSWPSPRPTVLGCYVSPLIPSSWGAGDRLPNDGDSERGPHGRHSAREPFWPVLRRSRASQTCAVPVAELPDRQAEKFRPLHLNERGWLRCWSLETVCRNELARSSALAHPAACPAAPSGPANSSPACALQHAREASWPLQLSRLASSAHIPPPISTSANVPLSSVTRAPQHA